MKKILVGIISVLCVLALVACGETPAENPGTDTPVETPAELPTEAEILEAYKGAQEAYFYANVKSLDVDYENTAEYNGMPVYKIVDYANLEELRAYFGTYFCDKIADEYTNSGIYIEIDGALYSGDGARGTDITKGNETQSVEKVSDTKFNVNVSVEILDPDNNFAVSGSEDYVFPYELVDGHWVFTDFPAIY